MKKIFIVFILSLVIIPLFAQTTVTLVDNQTVATPYKGGLELQIHHRFSPIKTIHNLYGIYGSANTRLGLNYGITDRIMIGIGTTKEYALQDIHWKYLILKQGENMPVSLSYYGNFVACFKNEDFFGPSSEFKQIHRLSYFTQFILARKFGEKFYAQIAPSVIYMNTVKRYSDEVGYKNLNFGLHAGAHAALFGNHSLMLEYDQLLTKQDTGEEMGQPKPNLALGWEIGTATHTFQVFAANYNYIVNQYNLLYSGSRDYLFGFNITVRF